MSKEMQPEYPGSSERNDGGVTRTAAEAIDEGLLTLLSLLWEAAQTAPVRPWSLAKLSKRSGAHMSTLLRQLNVLSAAELARTVERDSATSLTATIICAELTAAGRNLCAAIFAPAPQDRADP